MISKEARSANARDSNFILQVLALSRSCHNRKTAKIVGGEVVVPRCGTTRAITI